MTEQRIQWTVGIVVLIVLLVLGMVTLLYGVKAYNTLTTLQNNIDAQWGQIEVQYQRRADLIPNLVNTVKGFASQEQKLILGATELRTQWQNARTQQEKITAAQNIDRELDASNPESILGNIMVIVENYPQLKSDQNFLELQVELTNTENKISAERRIYNQAVQEYNRKIRVVPSNVIAGIFGFSEKEYFTADTSEVPQVQI